MGVAFRYPPGGGTGRWGEKTYFALKSRLLLAAFGSVRRFSPKSRASALCIGFKEHLDGLRLLFEFRLYVTARDRCMRSLPFLSYPPMLRQQPPESRHIYIMNGEPPLAIDAIARAEPMEKAFERLAIAFFNSGIFADWARRETPSQIVMGFQQVKNDAACDLIAGWLNAHMPQADGVELAASAACQLLLDLFSDLKEPAGWRPPRLLKKGSGTAARVVELLAQLATKLFNVSGQSMAPWCCYAGVKIPMCGTRGQCCTGRVLNLKQDTNLCSTAGCGRFVHAACSKHFWKALLPALEPGTHCLGCNAMRARSLHNFSCACAVERSLHRPPIGFVGGACVFVACLAACLPVCLPGPSPPRPAPLLSLPRPAARLCLYVPGSSSPTSTISVLVPTFVLSRRPCAMPGRPPMVLNLTTPLFFSFAASCSRPIRRAPTPQHQLRSSPPLSPLPRPRPRHPCWEHLWCRLCLPNAFNLG